MQLFDLCSNSPWYDPRGCDVGVKNPICSYRSIFAQSSTPSPSARHAPPPPPSPPFALSDLTSVALVVVPTSQSHPILLLMYWKRAFKVQPAAVEAYKCTIDISVTKYVIYNNEAYSSYFSQEICHNYNNEAYSSYFSQEICDIIISMPTIHILVRKYVTP